MKHFLFSSAPWTKYRVGILVKDTALNYDLLVEHYVEPLEQKGIQRDDIIAFDLDYANVPKPSAKLMRACLDNTLKALDNMKVEVLLICDANYFKIAAGLRKSTGQLGYINPCAIKEYEHMDIIYCPNYLSLFYNPVIQKEIDYALFTLVSYLDGTHTNFGKDIIHKEFYHKNLTDIEIQLNQLHQYDVLTCDIETFGLIFYKCGIGTISFSWSEHEGTAFTIDYDNQLRTQADSTRVYLKKFFEEYKGKLIYHNSGFDVTVLVYQLFMKNLSDQKGLIDGLEIMTRNIADTKIMAYLSLNSTAGNVLDLKTLVHTFAGNYAQEEIYDIRNIPEDMLLRYNLVDCLSTFHLYKKYLLTLKEHDQEDIYNNIMIPSMKVVIQMQLQGMALNKTNVTHAHLELDKAKNKFRSYLDSSPIIMAFNLFLQGRLQKKANGKLKVKVRDISEFTDTFNPNSNQQLQMLIYEVFGFTPTDFTKKKMPSVSGKTISKLMNKLRSEFNITDEDLK